MSQVQLYCVFHNKLSKELLIYRKDIVTFLGVNEHVEKDVGLCKDYKVIYEYEMDKYDPLFQECGYNESSAIVHLGVNNLHKDYEYVGFFQYDNIIGFALNLLGENVCLHTSAGQFNAKSKDYPLEVFLNVYNKYHGTEYTEQTIIDTLAAKNCSVPIWSTFVVHKKVYDRLWKFLLVLMYELFHKIKVDKITGENRCHRHVGSIMEYSIGLCLVLDSGLDKFIQIPIQLLGNKANNYVHQNGDDGEGMKTPDSIICKYLDRNRNILI